MGKHLDGERSEREQMRKTLLSQLQESERQVRKELQQLGDEHQGNHSKLKDLLSGGKDEHKKALQAALESVDAQLKREISRVSGDHKASYSKLTESLQEQKNGLEKQLAWQRAAHDEHKGQVSSAHGDLDKALRKDM